MEINAVPAKSTSTGTGLNSTGTGTGQEPEFRSGPNLNQYLNFNITNKVQGRCFFILRTKLLNAMHLWVTLYMVIG